MAIGSTKQMSQEPWAQVIERVGCDQCAIAALACQCLAKSFKVIVELLAQANKCIVRLAYDMLLRQK